MTTRTEKALVSDISQSVASLLPALEEFARFSGPDGAADRATWRPLLDEPLPVQGVGAQSVLATLRDVVIPRGSRLGHPGFSGWITTMPTTTATAAALAATWSAPQRWWVHPANFLDVLAARWLGTLLGFPSTYQGVFVSGGAMANLIGLGVARQHAAERQGVDASRDGVAALNEPRVYASSEVHHVLSRAAGVLGLGRRHLRTFAVDAAGKLDLAGLESALTEDVRAG
ncbi:MAG TPA: pyridoxal-dependent decarboxylase, partial [Myxococcota bacterium]|nr:pyridoxal-dependent decarboxylase [Myxococcota bacterium]